VTRCDELAKRQEYYAEYHDITGQELPKYIQTMPLDAVRRAICAARNGVIFGEPKTPKTEDESSLMDWDRQDEKNGNAYS
jgi:hypothetical protein